MKLHPLRLIFAGFLASMLSLSPLSAQQPSDNFQPEAQMPMPDHVGAVAVGKKWLVATANNVATEAGAKVLRAGGNAIDAAVAIAYALNVVEPQSAGIGGGGV